MERNNIEVIYDEAGNLYDNETQIEEGSANQVETSPVVDKVCPKLSGSTVTQKKGKIL